MYPRQRPSYGAPVQLTSKPEKSAPLPAEQIIYLQQEIRYILFYARNIDSTMLPALASLDSSQSEVTQDTASTITQILNYAATHPDANLRSNPSNMVLHIHSDASNLSKAKLRTQEGRPLFLYSTTTRLGKYPDIHESPPPPSPKWRRPQHLPHPQKCHVLRHRSQSWRPVASLYKITKTGVASSTLASP